MVPAFDTPRRIPSEVDLTLLWSGLLLLLLGMVMVYSASIAIAEAGRHTGNHPAYYLVRHGVFLAIGLVGAVRPFRCRCLPGKNSRLGSSWPASCCWHWC